MFAALSAFYQVYLPEFVPMLGVYFKATNRTGYSLDSGNTGQNLLAPTLSSIPER